MRIGKQVTVPELRDQAGAFVTINRDRINVQLLQLRHADSRRRPAQTSDAV